LTDLKIFASSPVQYQVPLYRELIKSGLECEVAYYHPGASQQAAYDSEFAKTFTWDIDLLTGYPYRFFKQGRATFRKSEQLFIAPKLLKWAMQDRKIPLLLMGWFAEVVWLVWLIRIIMRSPVMVFGDNTPQYFAARPKPAWQVTLLRWLLEHTKAVFYVGQLNRQYWLGMGVKNEHLFYTPHCVDNIRFLTSFEQLLPKRRELCHQYGLDPDRATFLYCGKLIPVKRPISLLEAYAETGLDKKAQLIYVGDGELRFELERCIREKNLKHVHLLGFLNQSQIPLAYVLGEILCLVSQCETWGLVVNEAMACGRPVLVTDSVGCAPDLVHPENGWIVPFDDPVMLVQILRQAYVRRDSWHLLGEAGQKRIQRYTYAFMAVGIQEALSKQISVSRKA
jgi:glycosyltransferase involved in cell wall biosynthesis